MRRQAASRSVSLTPSTWSKRAIAFRTWPASFSGSLRSLGKANFSEAIRSLARVLRPCERFVVVAMLDLLSLSGFRKTSLGNKEGRPRRTRPSCLLRRRVGRRYVGEGIADGEAWVPPPVPAPVPVVGAGLVTVGLLAGAL